MNSMEQEFLKEYVEEKLKEETLEPSDIMLKRQFDRAINRINFELYDEEKIKKIKSKFSNDPSGVFSILTFVCLLNIFKSKLMELDADLIVNLVIGISTSELNITKYEQYGKILLNANVIEKLKQIPQVEDEFIPLYQTIAGLIEDININKNENRILYDVDEILDKQIEYRKEEIEHPSSSYFFEDENSIMEIYNIVKEQAETALEVIPNFLDEDAMEEVNKIKKLLHLSFEDQQNYIKIVKKIDQQEIFLREKFYKIFNITDAFNHYVKDSNVISYDFRAK